MNKFHLYTCHRFISGRILIIDTIVSLLFLLGTGTYSANSIPILFNTTGIPVPAQRVYPEQLNGTQTPAYNHASIYEQIKSGLVTGHCTMLRFPGGAVSNYYHWNGEGSYTASGEWQPSTSAWKRGFTAGSQFRGTSQEDYFYAYSLIADNDTNTFWWSDPLVTETRPWVYLELAEAAVVDSVVIYWGAHYAVDFDIAVWDTVFLDEVEPYQSIQNRWTTVCSVTGNSAAVTKNAFVNTQKSYHVMIRINRMSGDSGVQIREIYALSRAVRVSVNKPSYEGAGEDNSQSRVIACGTHHGNALNSNVIVDKTADFDFKAFIDYCKSFPTRIEPVVNVNYATGSPQEAAEWVRYANVLLNDSIRYWAVGAEPDGAYNDATPVSASMFAEKFILFSKAMKQVDPTIKVVGPVLSTFDFDSAGSADFNDSSWMETFIAHIGKAENNDGVTYLDGIDFMCYPYWFDEKPDPREMLTESDSPYDEYPVLINYIQKYLPGPDSVIVFMCEYNIFPGEGFSLLNKPVTSACIANMYAGFAEQFAYRGFAAIWKSFNPLNLGTDGTYGALSLFTEYNPLLNSSFFHAPSAQYWALYTAGNIWLNPGTTQYIVKGSYERNGPIRAYGAQSDSWFHGMLINLTMDTAEAVVTLQGVEQYSSGQLFMWSEREFSWKGDSKNSCAMPNCGPTAMAVPVQSSMIIKLPPCALYVIALTKTPVTTPDTIVACHYGAYPAIVQKTDSCLLWASFKSNKTPVKQCEYRIDTGGTWLPCAALDGVNDGTRENSVLTIPHSSLKKGSYSLYVRARADNCVSGEYAIPVTVLGELRPAILINDFNSNSLQSNLPAKPSWFSYVGQDLDAQFNLTVESRVQSTPFIKAAFTISKEKGYDNLIHVMLNIPGGYLDTATPRVQGIQFSYSSCGSINNTFALAVPCVLVKDYDEFKYPLQNTNPVKLDKSLYVQNKYAKNVFVSNTDSNQVWKTISLLWSDFKQSGWGMPVTGLANSNIIRLDYTITGLGAGYFAFDDIAFISDSGESVVAIQDIVQSKSNRSSSLSIIQRKNNAILFEWYTNGTDKTFLQFYNLQGREIYRAGPFTAKQCRFILRADSNGGPCAVSGMYIANVRGGKSCLTKKFFITR